MNAAPSPRQLVVLRFLAKYIGAHGYPPTRREICEGIGLNASTGLNAAFEHLSRLERKGFVRVTRVVARGIVLTEAGREFLRTAEQPAPAEGGA